MAALRNELHERTEIPAERFVGWLGIAVSKSHDWNRR